MLCIVSPSELTARPVQLRDHLTTAGQKASPKNILNKAGFSFPLGRKGMRKPDLFHDFLTVCEIQTLSLSL